MGIRDLLKNFGLMAREAARQDGRIPEAAQSKPDIRHEDLKALKSESELLAFARVYIHKDEDLAIDALKRIKNQMRLRFIAIDPDENILLRLSAISRLEDEDTLRLIASADHDQKVALVALNKLESVSSLRQVAEHSPHENVRLLARARSAH